MNVIVTSAGRRTSLTNLFRRAVQRFGGQVIAADIDSLAPALYMADHAERVPRVTDPEYVSELLRITEKYNAHLLVPTIDTELSILANVQRDFSALGCRVHISSSEFVQIAGDKWLTAQAFAKHGVRVPISWLPDNLPPLEELPQRLFLKPRDGSASLHTYAIDRCEISETLKRVPNAIIQEEIKAREITVDAFISQEGQPVHFVPRLRIKTLAGESIQGVTLPSDERLQEFLGRVIEAAGTMGARGAITLQAFDTGEAYILLEINPRFGGGFPLGYAAGGTYPDWLLEELDGNKLESRLGEYEVGLYMTRSSNEIFTRQTKW